MSEGDRLKDLLLLYRSIEHQYRIGQYTDEALKSIQLSLDIARAQLFDEISYRDISMPKDRVDMVLEELNNLTLGIQAQLSKNIQDAAVVAGEYSYREYDNILSFDGKLAETVGFNHVSVSPDQLRAMVMTVPVGGKLLEAWVSDTFERRIIDEIQTEIMADNFQGLSTPKIIRHMENAFGMVKNDAETLVRTYLADINNQAADAVYKANSDIIKWESWNASLEVGLSGKSTCLRCASLDSRKFKIDEPHIRPPLHPRCVTADSIIFAPDAVAGIESDYNGPIAKIMLRSGRKISSTVNHMFLTSMGWCSAGMLAKGDDVFCCKGIERTVYGPDDNWEPTTIKQKVASLSESVGSVTLRHSPAGNDLHGDGIFCKGDINIVRANGFLSHNRKALVGKDINSHCLVETATRTQILSTLGEFAPVFECVLDAVGIPESREPSLFFRRRSEAISELAGGLFIPELDSRISELTHDGSPGIPELLGELVGRYPRLVEFDEVVDVDIHNASCKVYDLETTCSLYVANGFLSSNCRCFMLPETLSYRELGLNIDEMKESLRPYSERAEKRAIIDAGQFDGDFEKFLFSRDQKYQLDLLGPNRLRLIQEGKIKFDDLADKNGDLRLLKKDGDGNYIGLI